MIIFEILIYPFKLIVNFLTGFDDDGDRDYNSIEEFNKLRNDVNQHILAVQNDLENNENINLIDSLNETKKLYEERGADTFTIFNKEQIRKWEDVIMDNTEKSVTLAVERNLESIIDDYEGIIETFMCYDFSTFNLNLIKILDNMSKKAGIENIGFEEFVSKFYDGKKDLDWICRLLRRASSSPILDENSKEEIFKRLSKPILEKK